MTGTSGRQRVQIDLLGQYILTIALDSVYKEFDRITKSIIRKISQNDEEIKILSEIRDTLLPRLISGQLRIPDIEQI
ncbi:MAG: restriction endonuclease S subunit [bacterium]|nr:MAG: restriction endonuclease S subunit [bacterium]